MASEQKVKCPQCGAEMNHHANKITYPRAETEMNFYDMLYDGILEEHFKCPQCGYNLSRTIREKD